MPDLNCSATTPLNTNAVDIALLHQSIGSHACGTATTQLYPRRPLASLDDVRSIMATKSDQSKLKMLLRNNSWPVSHETRRSLWRLLAYGSSPKSDGIFNEYASKLCPAVGEQSDDNGNRVAVKDPDWRKAVSCHSYSNDSQNQYFLSSSGIDSVRRVLLVLGETNPHIGEFAFHLQCFASILLHYLPEEDCFDSLYALLKCKSVDYFLAPSDLSLQASVHVLCDLAYSYIKGTAMFLEHRCPDGNLHGLCSDWLSWLFQYLPFDYLVRIIDCYLVEGIKVLYRSALALMLLYHRTTAKGALPSETKVDVGMKKFCAGIIQVVSVEKLLQVGFGIRGFTRKQVAKLFTKYEQSLQHAAALGDGLLGTAKYVKPKSSFGMRSLLSGSIRRSPSTAAAEKGDMKISVQLIRMESAKGKLSRNHASFKFDHAIYSHIELTSLGSSILTKFTVAKVWSWLPEIQAVRDPCLIFTTAQHGYSIKRFYEHSETKGATLLLIRTVAGEVFGAYCSTDWCERQRSIDAGAQISYFGTGESFVFSLEPEARFYPWVGRTLNSTPGGSGDVVVPKATAHMFMAADNSMFTVGGGGGEALQVDENLDRGHSSFCDTFENAPLCGDGGQFQVQTLEAIAFY